jgi:hypothetical protein
MITSAHSEAVKETLVRPERPCHDSQGQRPRCYTKVDAAWFVPWGRLMVAPQFTAGQMGNIKWLQPPLRAFADYAICP